MRHSSVVVSLLLALSFVGCGGDGGGGADAMIDRDAASIEDARPARDAGPPENDAALAQPDAALAQPDAALSQDDAALVQNDAAPRDDASVASTQPFHAWITPNVLGAVTGGTISFTGTAVGGSGNYAYAWTFNGTPATATGAGPHPVTFNAATADVGALARVELTATDVTTGDVWSQRVELPVAIVAAPAPPAVSLRAPATPSVTVEQGGVVQISGTAMGPSGYQHLFFFGDAATHSIIGGNVDGAYASFPFTGTYTPRFIAYGYPAFEAASAAPAVTVTPELPGTLATGARIGPLQGVSGCYFCDAYNDNRIIPRLLGNGARFVAVFDQLIKAVDRDDSIIGAVYDSGWQPYVDLDASTGRGVSLIDLGEGNPINAHQLDAHMAPNGDAAVVFMQRTTSVNPMRNASQHMFANVLVGNTWTGAVQLDRAPDGGTNNFNLNGRVVTWREGNVTRALATWDRRLGNANAQTEYATFSSATMSWTAPAVIAGTGRLAVTPSGRVLTVSRNNDALYAGVFENGAWTIGTTPIMDLQEDATLDLATSADGTAMVLVGHDDDGVEDPVFAIRYDGTTWGAPVQIGALADLDALIPDVFGTGFTYEKVVRVKVAMDDSGNALAAWVADAEGPMIRSLPIGVSSYYSAASGSWTPFIPWTQVVSMTEVELLRTPHSSSDTLRIGLDLEGTRGIVTFALGARSLPQGSARDQLHYRHYDVATQSWGARGDVDTHPGHAHGHSDVKLRPDGSAMVIYEVFPAGTNHNVAGAVYAREL